MAKKKSEVKHGDQGFYDTGETAKAKPPKHLCDTCNKMFSFKGEKTEQLPKCTISGSVINDKIFECSQYAK